MTERTLQPNTRRVLIAVDLSAVDLGTSDSVLYLEAAKANSVAPISHSGPVGGKLSISD